jgi:hypothetical protein
VLPPPSKAPDETLELALLRDNKWPEEHRTISVRLMTTDGPLAFRVASLVAMHWNRASGLQFVFVSTPPSDIRVAFDYGASWSYVGTDCLTVDEPTHTMNLGISLDTHPESVQRTVLHEFGHALGFIHEHQSPNRNLPWNREAAYEFYRVRGWDRETVDRQVFGDYLDWAEAGVYDVDSIMHYAIPAELMLDGVARGGSHTLSAEDVAMARLWYGPPPAEPVAAPMLHQFLPVVRTDGMIVDRLAEWYPYAEDVTAVARRAGLPPERIPMSGSVLNRWDAVVRHARGRGQVGALLRAALDVYGAPAADVEQWAREEQA